MMFLNKITKITLWAFFGAVFAVSLYVNYLYVVEYIQNNKKVGQQQSYGTDNNYHEINFATVVSIDKQSIKVNKNQDGKIQEAEYIISENIEAYKSYLDPDTLKEKIDKTDINTVKRNMRVILSMNEDEGIQHQSVKKITILYLNSFFGQIKSIDKNLIKIIEGKDLMDKNIIKEIPLSGITKYYRAKNLINNEKNQEVKLEEISFSDLKVNDDVLFIFEDDLNSNPNQFVQKVIVLSKE